MAPAASTEQVGAIVGALSDMEVSTDVLDKVDEAAAGAAAAKKEEMLACVADGAECDADVDGAMDFLLNMYSLQAARSDAESQAEYDASLTADGTVDGVIPVDQITSIDQLPTDAT